MFSFPTVTFLLHSQKPDTVSPGRLIISLLGWTQTQFLISLPSLFLVSQQECEEWPVRGLVFSHPALMCPFLGILLLSFSSIFLFFTSSSYLSVNHSSVPSCSFFPSFSCLSSYSFWELCPLFFSQLSTLNFHKLQYISEPLWASVAWAAYFVKPHRDLKTTGPLHLLWNPSPPPPPSLSVAGGAHRPPFQPTRA